MHTTNIIRQSTTIPAARCTPSLSVMIRTFSADDPNVATKYAVHYMNHETDSPFAGVYTDSLDEANAAYVERRDRIGAEDVRVEMPAWDALRHLIGAQ